MMLILNMGVDYDESDIDNIDDIDYIDDIDDIDDIDIVHLGVLGQGCIRLRLWVHSSAAWNEYLSI